MPDVNSTLLVIILNVNTLNIPSKSQRLAEWRGKNTFQL